MEGNLFWSPEGKPISPSEYLKLVANPGIRMVAVDEVIDDNGVVKYVISTMWIGVNLKTMQTREFSLPLIYETCIFLKEKPRLIERKLYSNRESALAGHLAMLNLLTAMG